MTDASTYVYTLPEDYTIKPQHREKLDKLVDRLGLSNAAAQEFIDLHVEITEDVVEELEAAYASQH